MTSKDPPTKPLEYMTPLTVSVRRDQIAAVEEFQAERGLASRSVAMRHILDEWIEARPCVADSANIPELLEVLRKVIPQGDIEATLARWRRDEEAGA